MNFDFIYKDGFIFEEFYALFNTIHTQKVPLIRSALYGFSSHLVMYNSRSACKGSVSASGLTLWPHSHTLFREEVMFSEIWMSGCELKQTLLSLWINITVVMHSIRWNSNFYLRLCENDHTNKMNSYIGAESDISQKLRGLQELKIYLNNIKNLWLFVTENVD